jgi:hypothetical protein
VQRQARDEHPDPQALGLPRDGGEEHRRRWRRRQPVPVVLGEVVAIEAGGVGLAQQGEPPLVQLVERDARRPRHVVEDAELDRGHARGTLAARRPVAQAPSARSADGAGGSSTRLRPATLAR